MHRYFLTVVVMFLASAAGRATPGDVVRSLPAPGRTSTGLAFDGRALWVADHELDELIQIDAQSGKVLARLHSPGYRPAGLAWDGSALWNVDVREARLGVEGENRGISRIRPSDGLVTKSIPSPVLFPRALAWDGRALWVSDDQGLTIHQVDPEDGTTIREVPFPGRSVDGLAFDGQYLWVADRFADRLYAVHPQSGEVVVALRSPGPHPTGIAFDGERLLVCDYQTDRIDVVVRQDAAFFIAEEPRELWVDFRQWVRNFGPDALPTVDVFLAVPQDLPGQKLLGAPRFEPAPAEYLTDQWGQKVARFAFKDLAVSQAAAVRMKVHLTAQTVRYPIYPDRVLGLERIPAQIRRAYLQDAPKYDIRNPTIVKAVAEAVAAERNPYWIARKIYRYLHGKLFYQRIGGWDVAPKVLERGSGSCSEYSFVFIAMCRAAGLPARYAGALANRQDDATYDDVFHRWVEVYLPPFGWIPVDPSRGDKSSEAERADSFGVLSHDFLVTTQGGGGSSLLDWNYNSNERTTCRGRCRVETETIAEWSPEDPDVAR